MKLKVSEVDNTGFLNIKIKGNEEWLVDIYKNIDPLYEKDKKDNVTNIEADINISKTILANRYKITGTLQVSTEIECGRCCKKLKWNTSKKIQLYFINEKEEFIKEKDLKVEELDEYYPINIGILDLGVIVNDLVLESIPDNISDLLEHECLEVEEGIDDGYGKKIYSVGKNLSAFKDLGKIIEDFKKKKDK